MGQNARFAHLKISIHFLTGSIINVKPEVPQLASSSLTVEASISF